MANFAIFRVGEEPQYRQSVETSLFDSDPDAIKNPDLSAVQGVDLKYWKRVGNLIQEMDAAEKQAVDDAEQAVRDAEIDRFGGNVDRETIIKALIQIGNARWAIGQTVTLSEFRTVVRSLLP
jgi:hypothetical protein